MIQNGVLRVHHDRDFISGSLERRKKKRKKKKKEECLEKQSNEKSGSVQVPTNIYMLHFLEKDWRTEKSSPSASLCLLLFDFGNPFFNVKKKNFLFQVKHGNVV